MRIVEAHEVTRLDRAAMKAKRYRPDPLRRAVPLLAELISMVESNLDDPALPRKAASHLMKETVGFVNPPVSVVTVGKPLGFKLIDRANKPGMDGTHSSMVTTSIAVSRGGRAFTVAIPSITPPVLTRYRMAHAMGLVIAKPDIFDSARTVDILRNGSDQGRAGEFASSFAAELLIPESSFVFDFVTLGRSTNEYALAQQYGVPLTVMDMRIKRAELEAKKKVAEIGRKLDEQNRR